MGAVAAVGDGGVAPDAAAAAAAADAAATNAAVDAGEVGAGTAPTAGAGLNGWVDVETIPMEKEPKMRKWWQLAPSKGET